MVPIFYQKNLQSWWIRQFLFLPTGRSMHAFNIDRYWNISWSSPNWNVVSWTPFLISIKFLLKQIRTFFLLNTFVIVDFVGKNSKLSLHGNHFQLTFVVFISWTDRNFTVYQYFLKWKLWLFLKFQPIWIVQFLFT